MSFEDVSEASQGWRPARQPCALHHPLRRRPRTGSRTADRWKAAFSRNQSRRTSSRHLLLRFITLGTAKGRWWSVWGAYSNSEATAAESSRLISSLFFSVFFFGGGGGAVFNAQDRLSRGDRRNPPSLRLPLSSSQISQMPPTPNTAFGCLQEEKKNTI